MANADSLAEFREEYRARGWSTMPLHYKAKTPVTERWSTLTQAELDAHAVNGAQNIAVRLGALSGNLVDVDSDTHEARVIAARIMPATESLFGRKSSQGAHRLYITDKAPGTKACNDPTAKDRDTKARIIELRGTGGYTMMPGSVHPSGEAVVWERNGKPARCAYDLLWQRTQQVAAYALLASWWNRGVRDDLCATTIGILLRLDFTDSEIATVLQAIGAAADDEKINERITEKVGRLREALKNGRPVFGYVKLAELTADKKVADAVRKWLGGKEDAVEVLVGPEAALVKFEAVPYEVPVIVTGYLIEEAGAIVGPGGEGKSTLALYESVRLALGGRLYDREIVRPGPTLVITAEDRGRVVTSRLQKICIAMNLGPAQLAAIQKSIRVEDVGTKFAQLTRIAAEDGAVVTGPLVTELIEKYAGAQLSQLLLDPVSLLGPGERFGNDGYAHLLRIARQLAEALHCAVRLVHHVSQAVYRDGIKDQYAARGGTAFVDGSRFQHQLVVVTLKDRTFNAGDWFGDWQFPPELKKSIESGHVLAILTHKLSYEARARAPIFLVREGFKYEHITTAQRIADGAMSDAASNAMSADLAKRLTQFLAKKLAEQPPVRLTANEVRRQYARDLGMTFDQAERAATEAKRLGLVVEKDLPKEERQGKRQTYLQPTETEEI
jgi:hypothetical protein